MLVILLLLAPIPPDRPLPLEWKSFEENGIIHKSRVAYHIQGNTQYSIGLYKFKPHEGWYASVTLLETDPITGRITRWNHSALKGEYRELKDAENAAIREAKRLGAMAP